MATVVTALEPALMFLLHMCVRRSSVIRMPLASTILDLLRASARLVTPAAVSAALTSTNAQQALTRVALSPSATISPAHFHAAAARGLQLTAGLALITTNARLVLTTATRAPHAQTRRGRLRVRAMLAGPVTAWLALTFLNVCWTPTTATLARLAATCRGRSHAAAILAILAAA